MHVYVWCTNVYMLVHVCVCGEHIYMYVHVEATGQYEVSSSKNIQLFSH